MGRICYNCGSNKTSLKKGKWENWYNYENNLICHRCYSNLINHPRRNPIDGPKRLCFKDKRISLGYNPRIGICQWCGAVKGVDCKETQLHHIEYHDNDFLKDTVELCVSCHRKESWRLRRLTNSQ